MGLISNGTTIFDNGAMASGFGGSMVLVSSATASSSASIEFTLGDYKEYKLFLVNMHPATDSANLEMNFSTDNGSNYNVTKTTTFFEAEHAENDSGSGLAYNSASDIAQGTGFQRIAGNVGGDADQCCNGIIHIFNPSSTTFVKHFTSRISNTRSDNAEFDIYIAGYANTTSALTNIKFQMSSGNIDDGKILMFGIN